MRHRKAKMQAEEAGMERVQALIDELPRAGFRPGFAGRVAARLESESQRRLSAVLALHFRRLAPAALVLILALLAHNLLIDGSAQSAIEAALGLRPVTLEVAYDFNAALYAQAR